METLAETIVNSIGCGVTVGSYRFSSEEQRARLSRVAGRPSGEVVLWELVRAIEDAGFVAPKELEPRSVFRPEMLVKPLVQYLKQPQTNGMSNSAMRKAFSRVKRMFYVGKLKQIAVEDVVFHGTTNAGAPTFGKKKDVYKSTLRAVKQLRRGRAPEPLTVFHRGKNREVARPVFGYPFEMTLLESTFFQPMQSELVKHHSPYVGGLPNAQVSSYVNEVRWRSSAIAELDFSGFDGSLSGYLISSAFSIIQNCFDLTPSGEKEWDLVTRYFVTAPMLLSDGSVIKGRRHGVPSGSMFTQLVDSICNALIVEYVAERLKIGLTRFYVLGDDSIIGMSRKADISSIQQAASELGVIVNVKKSRTYWVQPGKPTYFLGHNRHSFVTSRPVEESVTRLLTPERLRDEYFSSDPTVRRAAYIERCRAYQDDNLAAWVMLEAVINQLQGFSRSPWLHQMFAFSFEYADRMKWDPGLISFLSHSRKRDLNLRAMLHMCA